MKVWVLSCCLDGTHGFAQKIFLGSVARPKKCTLILGVWQKNNNPPGQAIVLGGHLWRCRGELQPPQDRLAESSCRYRMRREKERIPLPIHKISSSWCPLLHLLCLPYCSQKGRGPAVKDFFHSFLLQKPFIHQGSRQKNIVPACNLRLCHYAYVFGTWIKLHRLLFIGPEKTVILVITQGKELISAWILLLG